MPSQQMDGYVANGEYKNIAVMDGPEDGRKDSLYAGLLGLASAVVILGGVFVPGWSGFHSIEFDSKWIGCVDAPHVACPKISISLSMLWANTCLEQGKLQILNYTMTTDGCGHLPTTIGSCGIGTITDVVYNLCDCWALCAKDNIHTPVPFCNKDDVYFSFVFPTIGTSVVLMFTLLLLTFGVLCMFSGTRSNHLVNQMNAGCFCFRVACCRFAQAGFALYCVAAVFLGLGLIYYLVQRKSSFRGCENDQGYYEIPIPIGYGFIISACALPILALGCHFAKQAKLIQEDLDAPAFSIDTEIDPVHVPTPTPAPAPPPPPPPAPAPGRSSTATPSPPPGAAPQRFSTQVGSTPPPAESRRPPPPQRSKPQTNLMT